MQAAREYSDDGASSFATGCDARTGPRRNAMRVPAEKDAGACLACPSTVARGSLTNSLADVPTSRLIELLPALLEPVSSSLSAQQQQQRQHRRALTQHLPWSSFSAAVEEGDRRVHRRRRQRALDCFFSAEVAIRIARWQLCDPRASPFLAHPTSGDGENAGEDLLTVNYTADRMRADLHSRLRAARATLGGLDRGSSVYTTLLDLLTDSILTPPDFPRPCEGGCRRAVAAAAQPTASRRITPRPLACDHDGDAARGNRESAAEALAESAAAAAASLTVPAKGIMKRVVHSDDVDMAACTSREPPALAQRTPPCAELTLAEKLLYVVLRTSLVASVGADKPTGANPALSGSDSNDAGGPSSDAVGQRGRALGNRKRSKATSQTKPQALSATDHWTVTPFRSRDPGADGQGCDAATAEPRGGGCDDANTSEESLAAQKERVERDDHTLQARRVSRTAQRRSGVPNTVGVSPLAECFRADSITDGPFGRAGPSCRTESVLPVPPRCCLLPGVIALLESSTALPRSTRWSVAPDPVMFAIMEASQEGVLVPSTTLGSGTWLQAMSTASPAEMALRHRCERLMARGGLPRYAVDPARCRSSSRFKQLQQQQFAGSHSWRAGEGADVKRLFCPSSESHAPDVTQAAGTAATRTMETRPAPKGEATTTTGSSASLSRPFSIFTEQYGADTTICARVYVALHRCVVGFTDPYLFTTVHHSERARTNARAQDDGIEERAQAPQRDDTRGSCVEPFLALSKEFLRHAEASGGGRRANEQPRTEGGKTRQADEAGGAMDSSVKRVVCSRGILAILEWACETGTLFLRLSRLCATAGDPRARGPLGSYGEATLEALRVSLSVLRRVVVALAERPGGVHGVSFAELANAQQRLRDSVQRHIAGLSTLFGVTTAPDWSTAQALPALSSATLLSRMYQHFTAREMNLASSATTYSALPSAGARQHSQGGAADNNNTDSSSSSSSGSDDGEDELQASNAGSGPPNEAADTRALWKRQQRRAERRSRKVAQAFDPLLFILVRALRPLHAHLHRWLTRAELDDAMDDFFIVPAHGTSASGFVLDVSPARLPIFISVEAAQEVLHAGVSLRALRITATQIIRSARRQLRVFSEHSAGASDAEAHHAEHEDAVVMENLAQDYLSCLAGGRPSAQRSADLVAAPSRAPLGLAVPLVNPLDGSGASPQVALGSPRASVPAGPLSRGSLAYWRSFYSACDGVLWRAAIGDDDDAESVPSSAGDDTSASRRGRPRGGELPDATTGASSTLDAGGGSAALPLAPAPRLRKVQHLVEQKQQQQQQQPAETAFAGGDSDSDSHITIAMNSEEDECSVAQSGSRVRPPSSAAATGVEDVYTPTDGRERIDSRRSSVLGLRRVAAAVAPSSLANPRSLSSAASTSRATTALYGVITEELRRVVRVVEQQEADAAAAQQAMHVEYAQRVLMQRRDDRLVEWKSMRVTLRVNRLQAIRDLVDDLTDAYDSAAAAAAAAAGGDGLDSESRPSVLLGRFVIPLSPTALATRATPPAVLYAADSEEEAEQSEQQGGDDALPDGPAGDRVRRRGSSSVGLPKGARRQSLWSSASRMSGPVVGFHPTADVNEEAEDKAESHEAAASSLRQRLRSVESAASAAAATGAGSRADPQEGLSSRYILPIGGGGAASRRTSVFSTGSRARSVLGLLALPHSPSHVPSRETPGDGVRSNKPGDAAASVTTAALAAFTADQAQACKPEPQQEEEESAGAASGSVAGSASEAAAASALYDECGFKHAPEMYVIASINDDEYLQKRVGPRRYDRAELDALLRELAELLQKRVRGETVASAAYLARCTAVARQRLRQALPLHSSSAGEAVQEDHTGAPGVEDRAALLPEEAADTRTGVECLLKLYRKQDDGDDEKRKEEEEEGEEGGRGSLRAEALAAAMDRWCNDDPLRCPPDVWLDECTVAAGGVTDSLPTSCTTSSAKGRQVRSTVEGFDGKLALVDAAQGSAELAGDRRAARTADIATQLCLGSRTRVRALLWCSRYYLGLAQLSARYLTRKALQLALLPPYGPLYRLFTRLLDVCLFQSGPAAARVTDAWRAVVAVTLRGSSELASRGGARSGDKSSAGRNPAAGEANSLFLEGGHPSSLEEMAARATPFSSRVALRSLNAHFEVEWQRCLTGADELLPMRWELLPPPTAASTRSQVSARDPTPSSAGAGGADPQQPGETATRWLDSADATARRRYIELYARAQRAATGSALSHAEWMTGPPTPFFFLEELRLVCGRPEASRGGSPTACAGEASSGSAALFFLLPGDAIQRYGALSSTLLFWKTVEQLGVQLWVEGMQFNVADVFFLCNSMRHVLRCVQEHLWTGLCAQCHAFRRLLQFGPGGSLFQCRCLEDVVADHRRFLAECEFACLLNPVFSQCRQLLFGLVRQLESTTRLLQDANEETTAARRRAMAAFHALVDSSSSSSNSSDDDGDRGSHHNESDGEDDAPSIAPSSTGSVATAPARSHGTPLSADTLARTPEQTKPTLSPPQVAATRAADKSVDAAEERRIKRKVRDLEKVNWRSRGVAGALGRFSAPTPSRAKQPDSRPEEDAPRDRPPPRLSTPTETGEAVAAATFSGDVAGVNNNNDDDVDDDNAVDFREAYAVCEEEEEDAARGDGARDHPLTASLSSDEGVQEKETPKQRRRRIRQRRAAAAQAPPGRRDSARQPRGTRADGAASASSSSSRPAMPRARSSAVLGLRMTSAASVATRSSTPRQQQPTTPVGSSGSLSSSTAGRARRRSKSPSSSHAGTGGRPRAPSAAAGVTARTSRNDNAASDANRPPPVRHGQPTQPRHRTPSHHAGRRAQRRRERRRQERHRRRSIFLSIAERTIEAAHEQQRRRIRDAVRARLRSLSSLLHALVAELTSVRDQSELESWHSSRGGGNDAEGRAITGEDPSREQGVRQHRTLQARADSLSTLVNTLAHTLWQLERAL